MSKEYLEALNGLFDLVHCQDSFEKAQKCFDIIEEALKRLEAIDNANPSEALNVLKATEKYTGIDLTVVKNALLKAQEQEKENELLKEIIKSLFDRGCPLHQYTDKEGILTIEVDDECSNMRLGEYKGIDLDKKLKEVLE